MSDIAIGKSETSEVSGKPVPEKEEIKFPPFPDPKDDDFDEDIPEEERNHYKTLYKDLNSITSHKLHCTACDRHLGCSARNDSRMRTHPMLRTLVCQTCHTFYNSGEFEKGDDGSELYCRWCGQGGQVYCCSDCPHVFCAKCIKRNLGTPKIKEIEQLDDWKCFKCNNRCLWDLRALCWAVIRYCDLKNNVDKAAHARKQHLNKLRQKRFRARIRQRLESLNKSSHQAQAERITYAIEDPALKEACQTSCAQDFSECCKSKNKRREKQENKKKENDATSKKVAASLGKLPPTIQVKKFASINTDEVKPDKKAQKRPASPRSKIILKSPISIPNKMINNQLNMPSLPKKIRMSSSPVINPVRFNNDRKLTQNFSSYARIRPRMPQMPVMYNGFNSVPTFSADNINLSLESLTQGLDMSAMVALTTAPPQDDDVVCTPDFPLEPVCEVTEDNGDDDVQCITPGPVAAPKPAPAVRGSLPDLNPDNIIQMTDNDVTVNSNTGGLKFRVDPQTLSSNKMYRLPDGRIFAINANPNMPGGYSATIVAVTDNNVNKVPSKGTTFAAKLNAVPSMPTPPPSLKYGNRNQPSRNAKRSSPKSPKVNKVTEKSRPCDLNVPVEWYRYNLVDAIDALEYSLSRLHQLKKDATTTHLRTRSINEMRILHRSLERAMSTSMTRFKEIRDNLNKEFRQYVLKKSNSNTTSVHNSDDDDDDVEILPEEDNDDLIYIDENSMESNQNDNQEVDLTVAGSSDFNDSSDKSFDKNNASKDPLSIDQEPNSKDECNELQVLDKENGATVIDKDTEHLDEDNNVQSDLQKDDGKNISDENEPVSKENVDNREDAQKKSEGKNEISSSDINGQNEKPDDVPESENVEKLDEENILDENSGSEKKMMDTEMSEEMIEDLLKDESGDNDTVSHCEKAADNADDDLGMSDDLTTVTGDDAIGISDDAMEIGDDAVGNGDDVAGKGDGAASDGVDAAKNGDNAASNGDNAAGDGVDTQNVHSLDVSDEVEDVNKESEKD